MNLSDLGLSFGHFVSKPGDQRASIGIMIKIDFARDEVAEVVLDFLKKHRTTWDWWVGMLVPEPGSEF